MLRTRVMGMCNKFMTQIKPTWITTHRTICFDPPVVLNGFGQLAKLITRKSFEEEGVNVMIIYLFLFI